MLVEATFWFHPLVWWIGARLVEERELACDEAVLAQGSNPRDYAEAILGVCKHYVEALLACVFGVTGADIKKRLEAILTPRNILGLDWSRKFLPGQRALLRRRRALLERRYTHYRTGTKYRPGQFDWRRYTRTERSI